MYILQLSVGCFWTFTNGREKKKIEEEQIFIEWVLENKKMVSDRNSFVSTKPEERRVRFPSGIQLSSYC